MYRRLCSTAAFFGLLGGFAHAQTMERRANFTGGGGPEGRCTVEVIVDGAAEVEIRGDRALLRNLYGQTPQWRRFECTSPMPGNPVNFRFQGVDGRGRQNLVGDPRRGGPVVVRIEDPDNGSEGYTFDVFWQGAGGGFPPQGGPGPGPGYGGPGRDRGYRGRTSLDDNPGRQDWVIGTFEARRGQGRLDVYSFSCSVDFQSGRVRSADFQ